MQLVDSKGGWIAPGEAVDEQAGKHLGPGSETPIGRVEVVRVKDWRRGSVGV